MTEYTLEQLHVYVQDLHERIDKQNKDYVWMSDMYRKLVGELGAALKMTGVFPQDYGTDAMVSRIHALEAEVAELRARLDKPPF